jgi:hypothetical protein
MKILIAFICFGVAAQAENVDRFDGTYDLLKAKGSFEKNIHEKVKVPATEVCGNELRLEGDDNLFVNPIIRLRGSKLLIGDVTGHDGFLYDYSARTSSGHSISRLKYLAFKTFPGKCSFNVGTFKSKEDSVQNHDEVWVTRLKVLPFKWIDQTLKIHLSKDKNVLTVRLKRRMNMSQSSDFLERGDVTCTFQRR